MRRSFLLLVVSVGVLLVTSCGGNNGGRDASVAGEDVPGLPDDAAIAGTDASTIGLDAAAAGGDAAAGAQDGALIPASCTPITNVGCGDGGVCFTLSVNTVTGSAEYACGPAGALGDYAACTSSLDCQANLSCLTLASEPAAVCHQYCSGAVLACPGGTLTPETCVSYGASVTAVGYCIRVTPCDLFTQDCATDAGAVGCYPVSSGGAGCLEAGSTAIGTACTTHAQCTVGAVCVEAGGATRSCREVCDPSDGGVKGCTTPQTCHEVNGRPYGYCQ